MQDTWGRGGPGGGVENNNHMGNIIVCPAGPKKLKYWGYSRRIWPCGEFRFGTRMPGGVKTLQRTNEECATCMRSEHENSLYFISGAADFLYNNFPKKYILLPKTVDFLYNNFPKKPFSRMSFFKEIDLQFVESITS